MRRCGGRDSCDFIIFLIRILRFHHSLCGSCSGGAVSGSKGCGRCGSFSISSIFMRYDIYNTVRYMQHMRTLQQPHQTWLLINTSLQKCLYLYKNPRYPNTTAASKKKWPKLFQFPKLKKCIKAAFKGYKDLLAGRERESRKDTKYPSSLQGI